MELPALFYGLYRDVKRRTSKIVTQLLKGADWISLVEAEGFLDVDTTPGLIVLKGPSKLLGGEPHFQQWLPWSQVLDRLHQDVDSEIAQAVFKQSLTLPWSTLGLVAKGNYFWFIRRHRYRPFLRAVRQYWDTFASVGARYTYGVEEGYELWSVNNSIQYVLANLGLSNEEMDPPWPPGGLPELIDRTEQHLH